MDENPTPEQLQLATLAYYETHAENVVAATRNPRRGEWRQPFLDLLPARAHVLDAGSGAGYDSLEFARLGFDVTAMDASTTLAHSASQLLQRQVLVLKFEDIDFEDQFEGIWACASLLHVPPRNLPQVLTRLANALKARGVLYANFVVGQGQTTRGGILFNDFTEESLKTVLAVEPALELLRMWKTPDLAPARPGWEWLHMLARKTG